MKIRSLLLCFLISFLYAVPAVSVLPDMRGPTSEVEQENAPEFVDLFTVTFENSRDGRIFVEQDGKTLEIGRVLVPAVAVNPEGYTASGWAPPGAVAATAVNAVHFKVRQGETKGVIISFLPVELFANPEDFNSMYQTSASVITDIPAGTGFFGGGWAPFVGSPVEVDTGAGFVPLPEDYTPASGHRIRIRVQKPARMPSALIFENRFGGYITADYPDGTEKVIGMVLKPAFGVGRFGGSEFAEVGRIRANHTGVICISTSPRGVVGGIQIIPENHGMSPEMSYARQLTQWMVVGPPRVDDPSTEGVAPMFHYFIRPVYYEMGGSGRTIEQMLEMFIVQAKMLGSDEWVRMPTLTGRDDTALMDLRAIRILFPIEADFLKD